MGAHGDDVPLCRRRSRSCSRSQSLVQSLFLLGPAAAAAAAAAPVASGNSKTNVNVLPILLSAAAATAIAEAAKEPQVDESSPLPPSYQWEPFKDWDCIGVKGALDWDALYFENEAKWSRGEDGFEVPSEAYEALRTNLTQMLAECPLGALYYLVLDTYRIFILAEEDREARMGAVQAIWKYLSVYPYFLISSSRWATWEALYYFSELHRPRDAELMDLLKCKDTRDSGGQDWPTLFNASIMWSNEHSEGKEPDEGLITDYSILMKEAAGTMWHDGGTKAQEDCPHGYIFFSGIQAMVSMLRITGDFELWARAIDFYLSEMPFYSIAASGWPTLRLFAMQSASLKTRRMPALGDFQGDVFRRGKMHPVLKRYRAYGDLLLRTPELAPFGRDAEGWALVDELVSLWPDQWVGLVRRQDFSKLRPIFHSTLEAVESVVMAMTRKTTRECGHSGITEETCLTRGCLWVPKDPKVPDDGVPSCRLPKPERKVIGVSFVWGENWAKLVGKFVFWMTQLNFHCILVAMGEACRKACEIAVSGLSQAASTVSCWDPFEGGLGDPQRGSILQRHAIIHVLLHLGLDVVAFDFDTFWFSDPRMRFEELAAETKADVMMTRHLDADCFNMGLLYIRASSRSAEWYSKYLEWLHLHPYEREQRGVNFLLGFTNQKVSFAPKDMPKLKVGVLDDENEFASSRGGWLGNWTKIRFFHWVNLAAEVMAWATIKRNHVTAFYQCALNFMTRDLMARRGPFSFPQILAEADPESLWGRTRKLLDELSVKVAPPRQV
eukprot:CAMPEP_0206526916 /NCGR_PEP_ID=MMETSP0325_2-20121206/1026_1 /ASSEMBLY_ACC=CAM_ASM_000347 /TAXON_ID=2866 /ORGANISM="Crypthecodinium cohnii, Strain Seligo" /LENGTH=779 /DNA_ID=CAMNT_0054022203 /DNA_START=103 /DNA_END=2439 /DNA_ORIENTATION=-